MQEIGEAGGSAPVSAMSLRPVRAETEVIPAQRPTSEILRHQMAPMARVLRRLVTLILKVEVSSLLI